MQKVPGGCRAQMPAELGRGQAGGQTTVTIPRLEPPLPPLPRLKAPAPLEPLYLARPLGGAAARPRAPPTVLSRLRSLSRSRAGLSVVPPRAPEPRPLIRALLAPL